MSYVPFFNCPYCGNTVTSQVAQGTTIGGLAHGFLPMCGCAESLKEEELKHRMRIEARKVARRRR